MYTKDNGILFHNSFVTKAERIWTLKAGDSGFSVRSKMISMMLSLLSFVIVLLLQSFLQQEQQTYFTKKRIRLLKGMHLTSIYPV